MDYKDIEGFISDGSYSVDHPLCHLEEAVIRYQSEYGLELNPDFQRGHVWTDEQSSRYVEFLFRGGQSSRLLYFNHPSWMKFDDNSNMVLVDGLQRLKACLNFLRNNLRIFGYLRSEFTGIMPSLISLRFNINSLKTKAEVLQWYLDLNSGGVVHSNDELNKVREMLEREKQSSVV